eukprot:CAMPEP_0194498630 /NCGR_PEP_ID=MMETSP0253-20130528/15206_1 /TAXON_ID=2966 /ORGANISM="Noctiluca scintillans" /LENGTH=381 /DNA_ID=CAMNT_0039340297 /DNA_START=95 /DNA_END=1240 /DNA_ORIENTATION=-
MTAILVPLFSAFFIVMLMLPATDFIEKGLLMLVYLVIGNRCEDARRILGRPDQKTYSMSQNEGGPGEMLDSTRGAFSGVARGVATFVVIGSMVGVGVLIVLMIHESALHMQENWVHYEAGTKRMMGMIDKLFHHFSDQLPSKTVEGYSDKGLLYIQETLSSLVEVLLEEVSDVSVTLFMTFLYIAFWLSEPLPLTRDMAQIVQRYMMLKVIVSAGYASCVSCLLYFLLVDLSVVIGLLTFMLNFIPEVGPIVGMALPLPIILLDGRLEDPLGTAVIATLGTLTLKCLFGNIIEVKLIGRDRAMTLHPVIVLFCVAFFGWIWGATGMLLSVPLVAIMKSLTPGLPWRYRNTILVLLEGNLEAPTRFTKMSFLSTEQSTNSAE